MLSYVNARCELTGLEQPPAPNPFNQVFYFTAIQGYLCKRPFHNVLQCHRVEKATLVGVWTGLQWALGSCCSAVCCVSGAEASAKDTRSKRSASWVFLPANPKAPFSYHFLSYPQTLSLPLVFSAYLPNGDHENHSSHVHLGIHCIGEWSITENP